jgi:hypothetical protein
LDTLRRGGRSPQGHQQYQQEKWISANKGHNITPEFWAFCPGLQREKMESQPTGIRRFLQGKDLIQLGTFSIPNPDGGVKINYRITPKSYFAQNPLFAALGIIW